MVELLKGWMNEEKIEFTKETHSPHDYDERTNKWMN